MSFPCISRQYPLILASSSPRRKRLLEQISIPFRSITSDVTENCRIDDPKTASVFLAEKKAVKGHAISGDLWVLGADTMVAIDGRILGKPGNKEDARKMLSLLSGKEHRVITGFCIINPALEAVHSEAVSTLVRIKKLKQSEIKNYIDTGEPFGKAGSYAIQGVGSFMVETISGSYTNVVGLPVCALIKALISVGALKKCRAIYRKTS